MALFDSNCPEFFAPEERQDYRSFLEDSPTGYEVCEVDARVLGAFGLHDGGANEKRIDWLMVDAKAHGAGVGTLIMERAIQLARACGSATIGLATSQKVAPFYQKFGAEIISVDKDGFGAGLDRVEMALAL